MSLASTYAPRNPPKAAGWPVIGILPAFRRNSLAAMEDGWRTYGDLFRANIGPRVFLVVSSPDLAHEVLVTQQTTFKRSNNFNGGTPLTYMLGLSLLTTDGESWLSKRRMMQPIFHRNRIAEMGSDMAAAGEAMLARWRQVGHAPLDLATEMKRVTLDIINRTMFGKDVLPEFDRIGGMVDRGLDYIGERIRNPVMPPLSWPTPGNRRFLASRASLDAYLYKVIAERRASDEHPGDLLDMLLQAQDADTGERMNDQQVRNEVAGIYGAGHETTAVALTWTWHLLNRHPQVLAKLHAELAREVGTRPIAPADLPKLPYTLAVLEEAMRLLPPVPITARMAFAPTTIGGYQVNKGELAMISIYNIHRHPQFWPDATMFKPERFLPENKGTLHRSAYLPFLSGGHMCIGNHFALMEGQLLLAMMAQQFDVHEVAGQVVEKHVAVTMRPKNGLMVQLTPR